MASMNSSKRDHGHKLEARPVSLEALKNQRMLQEQAKKDAGIWGDMSVAVIEHSNGAFVHVYKGLGENSVHRLAAKRPKEISKAEHEALCLWLKAGGYDGFKHRISAWNVNADEAARMKQVVIAELTAAGTRVVNAPA
jgi:hypothetical protein